MIYTDKHAIQLILNGYEYTPNDIRISKIIIYESVQLHVPSIEILAGMPEIQFAQFVSSDIIKGKLIISRRERDSLITIVNMPIKYNNTKSISNLETVDMKLLFDFDWEWGYSASPQSFVGTSGDIFQKIGLESKFNKVITTSTNDNMIWINPNYRGTKFLTEVCSAAYFDEFSCFQWGIRSDNSLIFRNIAKRNNNSSKIANIVLGDINTIYNYAINSKPAILNRIYGYGRACMKYNYKDNSLSEISKFKIMPLGDKPLISNYTNQGSYRIPANFGNTHPKYQDAIIQNLRIKSSFNTNIKISLTNDNTNLNLLDDIIIVNNLPSTYSTLNKLNGIITGRAMIFEKNTMNYSISIDTNGFNTGDVS